MTTSALSSPHDADVTLFFQELKGELRHFSADQIVSVVRIVLSHIRSYFTPQHVNQITTQTPVLFQFVFMGNWSYVPSKRQTIHLDELVQELLDEEHRFSRGLFKSEIETLRIVIVVLKRINLFLKKWGINPYPYTLTRELQQAAQGESV